jgi:leucyl-tRNA synthetase
MTKKINFSKIEKKWQDKWEKAKVFEVSEKSKKEKYYVLEMFAYPSGTGLHIGHAFNYTIGDIFSRFKRMNKFNVMYPTGFDALVLPSENASISAKTHKEEYTKKSIMNFIKQQKALGLSYDWSRLINTSEPEYYKWDQWIFLKMFEKGLVYKKNSPVNWCPQCNTVLANEQVHDGKCEYHSNTNVEVKHLNQWYLKITDYAEELNNFNELGGWPDRIKKLQKNWIGKSYGTEINFEINNEKWPIFTTRPDTIFGVTFMVVSAQHSRLMELVTDEQKKEVGKFVKKLNSVSEEEIDQLEKEGVFTGSYAINPINREKIPVWAGNFVLADYGGGMVMAVPGHDQRDFEFAKKYKIPIKEVIIPSYGRLNKKSEFRETISAIIHRKKDNKFLLLKWKEYGWVSPIVGGIEENESLGKAAEREVLEETGYKTKFIKLLGGKIESHFFAENKKVWRHRLDQPILLELIDNKSEKVSDEEKNKHEAIWLNYTEAMQKITHEDNKLGLRRYIEGEHAFTEEGTLVNSRQFNGLNNRDAIEKITKFLESKKIGKKTINFRLRDWLVSRQRYWGTPIPIIHCEKCGAVPVPEKDLPVKLPEKVKFGKGNPLESADSWIKTKCPKCNGIGKRETDTMDTFVNSSWYFLRYCDTNNNEKIFDTKKTDYWCPIDMYIGGNEHACMHLIYARFYTKFLRDIGLLKINEPAIRLFNQGMIHAEDGNKMSKSLGNTVDPLDTIAKYSADSLRLFIVSVASPDSDFNWGENGVSSSFKFLNKVWNFFENIKISKSSEKIESKINQIIKEITQDIEEFKYNLAVIKLRQLFESIENEETISKKDAESFLRLLSPFCPHIAEELWEKLGNKSFISLSEWPKTDEKKINKKFEQQDKAVEKLKQDINNIKRIIESRGEKKEKVYVYVLPNELNFYQNMEGINVFSVADKNKYDPTNKSKNAKPGKPAIYFE